MNRSIPALPTARRKELGQALANSPYGQRRVPRRNHVCLPYAPPRLRRGLPSGEEDAGSGELLAEANALQNAFFDLDGKTRRAVAMEELSMAAILETMEHPENCICDLCRALAALG